MHLIYCLGKQRKNPPNKNITIPLWNGDAPLADVVNTFIDTASFLPITMLSKMYRDHQKGMAVC